jgi:hypothetical protein
VKRIYHPYWNWEDIAMWRKLPASEEPAMLARAFDMTGDADEYGRWMLRVIEEWPIASAHNLTDQSLNKQAWIGHAAAQMAIESPEYITRRAWWMLTQEQRDAANLKADIAIYEWHQRTTAQGGQLRLQMA